MRVRSLLGPTLVLLTAVGCGNTDAASGAPAASASAQGVEQAATLLKEAVALISAYRPFVAPVSDNDKFAPKAHASYKRAAAAAANEIRQAANEARQKIPSSAGAVGSDLEKALVKVATSCADAADEEAFAKCEASIPPLDEALAKASTSSGVTFARVGPASISESAKKSVSRIERLRGPGKAEAAFIAKRSDPAASVNDVIGACHTAADEISAVAADFERSEELFRLVGVTHKMNIDTECHHLEIVADLATAVDGCKKTPKKPECQAACGKAKTEVSEGMPAATFAPFEKSVADNCK